MTAACPAFDPSGPYVSAMLQMVDCHLQGLAQDGWEALAAPSGFGAGLTGLLTILIALLGYRLMLGEGLVLRDGVLMTLRVGVVLALCTQWAAWDAIAFRVGMQGPQALAEAMLLPGGLGGEDRYGLAMRFDRLSAVFTDIARADAAPVQPALPAPPAPFAPLSIDQKKELASASATLIISPLAGLIAVRAVVALLLAVGPLFVASLLFETTRSLFAGWVRGMVGVMLAALAVPMVLALELAVVEPQTQALVSVVGSGMPLNDAITRIWASSVVFAVVLAIVMFGAARGASAFRLPESACRKLVPVSHGERAVLTVPVVQEAIFALPEGRSRAQRVADAALTAQRRDENVQPSATESARVTNVAHGVKRRDGEPSLYSVPQGLATRRWERRASPGAVRRDTMI